MESHVNGASARYTELTTAFYEGNMSAAAWIEQMRTEQRRLTLQNSAIGGGGWDRLTSKQFGRAGGDLRGQYAKIAGTAQDITEGKITLAQALARANEYAGAARSHFWQAERETVVRSDSSMVIVERRVLGSSEHCPDCIELYNKGFQLIGSLPPPGTDTRCRGNCHCRFVRKEVPASQVGEWLGTKRA